MASLCLYDNFTGNSGLVAVLVAVQEMSQQHKAELSGVPAFTSMKLMPCRYSTGILRFFSLISIITGLVLISSVQYLALEISPYKDLSKILNIKGAQIIEQHSSPLGLLSIVESPQIPFRFAPGLSLHNTQEPPEQLGLFSDAGNMTVINHYPDQLQKMSYLDQLTSALPFHLGNIQQLLIVGGGGGSDILQALFHNAGKIDVLELNPQIIDLLLYPFAAYSGHIYSRDNIQVYADDVRGFLSKNKTDNVTYDLIQIALLDSFTASASGLYALHESYVYTIEALQIYLQHLNENGYLAISRWVKTPPRDSIKMFATAIRALEQSQIQDPARHLILIRGWQTSTLLVKRNPFTQLEFKHLKQFCQTRAFDIVWYAGINTNEINRFNHLRQPWFYQAASALLSDSKSTFMQNYKYDVIPATDDKPFFHHFFKWSVLGELLSLRNQGGFALIEMGYIVLFVTLILAIISSVILIFLPLVACHFSSAEKIKFSLPLAEHIRLFIYFFSIGVAFLFIEIAMMQKMIVFLHHPIYAIPVVLTAFLIFAGLGSVWTKQLMIHLSPRLLLFRAILSIVTLGLFYSYFSAGFFSLMAAASIAVKIILSFILIAPLAVAMGMPFPLALSSFDSSNRSYIPWAWGINGCASVISAILASLLAIHIGFTVIILIALGLYLLCLIVFNPKKLPDKLPHYL